MTVQENISLAPYTTFRIGGAARFFAPVKNIADIEEVITFSETHKIDGKNLPIFVLGGGSNVLISDSGWDGLVMKMELKGLIEEDEKDFMRIIAGAGEDWDDLLKYIIEERGLHGLENLSSIPGTVGASPVQNIGAYGAEAKDMIEWVEVYDPATKKVERLSNADCRFGYRDSIFKHERKGNIILRVAYLLKKEGKPSIEYKDLQRYFAGRTGTPSLCEVRQAIKKIRANKFPDLSKTGTAGSFFRNIVMARIDYQELLRKYPRMPAFSINPSDSRALLQQKSENPAVKVPTAWILDNVCGFKGLRRGDVGVYEKQALVLVNFGKGTAEEVKKLAAEIVAGVKEKTGITITPEVEFVG